MEPLNCLAVNILERLEVLYVADDWMYITMPGNIYFVELLKSFVLEILKVGVRMSAFCNFFSLMS